MRRLRRYFIALLVILVVAVGGLKLRYPQMSMLQSSSYVVSRLVHLSQARLGMLGPYGVAQDPATELANVRNIVRSLVPKVETANAMQKALILRDLVYRRVPLKVTAAGFNFFDLDNAIHLSLNNDNYGHICGGLVITYLTVLRAFGVPSRAVSLYHTVVDAPDPLLSHASVEVFADGQWIAMDPTYQFSIVDVTGRRLGWFKAYENVKNGNLIRFPDDGYGTLPKRTLREYTGGKIEEFTKTMNYLVFGPALINNKIEPSKIFPAGWDGIVRYTDGRQEDVSASAKIGIYSFIARPAQHLH